MATMQSPAAADVQHLSTASALGLHRLAVSWDSWRPTERRQCSVRVVHVILESLSTGDTRLVVGEQAAGDLCLAGSRLIQAATVPANRCALGSPLSTTSHDRCECRCTAAGTSWLLTSRPLMVIATTCKVSALMGMPSSRVDVRWCVFCTVTTGRQSSQVTRTGSSKVAVEADAGELSEVHVLGVDAAAVAGGNVARHVGASDFDGRRWRVLRKNSRPESGCRTLNDGSSQSSDSVGSRQSSCHNRAAIQRLEQATSEARSNPTGAQILRRRTRYAAPPDRAVLPSKPHRSITTLSWANVLTPPPPEPQVLFVNLQRRMVWLGSV